MKVWGGGHVAATILAFYTIEGYAVGFLIGVSVVEIISILGGEKGSGKVLSDGSEEIYNL